MYESLKSNITDFHLYIFAFDDLSHTILQSLNPDHTTIISLQEFESPDLLAIKAGRTKAEYCWTCTPSVIDYVLQKFEVPNCTYLDADLVFYNSPESLTDEMDDQASVLITEHRFSKLARVYEEERAGRFCVQFVTFNQDTESREILENWKNQCLDWCYDRYEDGKFGDQKYLDAWPDQYKHVHILNHPGGGVAPWNVQKYKIFEEDQTLWGRDKKTGEKFLLIFYHFQYVKLLTEKNVDIGWHFIPHQVINALYLPYIKQLFATEQRLSDLNSDYRTFYSNFRKSSIKDILKLIFKKTTGYNLIRQKGM